MICRYFRGPNMKNALGKMIAGLEAVRKVGEQMPIQTAHCFLLIAMKPGINMAELSKLVGISQASCSRNVAALGEWHRLGKPGFDLVEAIEDPEARRRKIMFLTHRGRAVAKEVIKSIDPTIDVDTLDLPTAKEWVNKQHRLGRVATA